MRRGRPSSVVFICHQSDRPGRIRCEWSFHRRPENAVERVFVSGVDLVERLKKVAPLNAFDRATFYGGGAKGYTDYPALGEAVAAG